MRGEHGMKGIQNPGKGVAVSIHRASSASELSKPENPDLKMKAIVQYENGMCKGNIKPTDTFVNLESSGLRPKYVYV